MSQIITDEMKKIAMEHPGGIVGTVNADGTPNVSPKGTMVVLDDSTIAFGEIRSPTTLKNILERPAMEINFVDVLSRRCFRAKGLASAVKRESPEFESLFPNFEKWGELSKRIRHIIVLKVTETKLVSSPSYDIGESEDSLKSHWKSHFANLN